MTTYGYARVSTPKQHASLVAQREALRAKGIEDRHIYADACSGAKKSRPEFDALARAVGEDDVIVCSKIDRLGRTMFETMETILELSQHGVSVETGDAGVLDPHTASGEAQINLMLAFAQFERRRVVERTNEGLAHARAQGKKLGRPPKVKPETRSAIIAAHKSGVTISSLAKVHGLSRDTVRRALNTTPYHTWPLPAPMRGGATTLECNHRHDNGSVFVSDRNIVRGLGLPMENVILAPGVNTEPECIETALRCAVAATREDEDGTVLVRAIGPSWVSQTAAVMDAPWLIITAKTQTPAGRVLHVLDVESAPFVSAKRPTKKALQEVLGGASALMGPAARQLLVEVLPRDRGRPSLSDSGESPRRNIRLPKSLDDLLVQRAEAANSTVSQTIRAAIEEYVQIDIDVSTACAEYEHAECDGVGLHVGGSEALGQCPCECHAMTSKNERQRHARDNVAPLHVTRR